MFVVVFGFGVVWLLAGSFGAPPGMQMSVVPKQFTCYSDSVDFRFVDQNSGPSFG